MGEYNREASEKAERFCKKCEKSRKNRLRFLKKSVTLKSVDEYPHKQVKNYKIKIKNVANTK